MYMYTHYIYTHIYILKKEKSELGDELEREIMGVGLTMVCMYDY